MVRAVPRSRFAVVRMVVRRDLRIRAFHVLDLAFQGSIRPDCSTGVASRMWCLSIDRGPCRGAGSRGVSERGGCPPRGRAPRESRAARGPGGRATAYPRTRTSTRASSD